MAELSVVSCQLSGGGDGRSKITFTHYPLPITHYPLPITHYPLPITHY
ncbi:hypothetical protein MEO40_16645 [Dolichospermum sp. ST_sed1]|nr:hypothetical protein [Dolichospermum sp. ST_sed1]MDD1423271.1 hypothetical protein [Dolichospermum sp. ST_sed9]MDD1432422.1 hypothetical protein [Dolichospermum sp. ST_sed6]MDD1440446.1 hypothetical protein [Dolichospermum sp. ST_sed3]MDD1468391.1 hypothetical protein [Dolichospermum sp. ST_sed5]MDD1470294.1 hypothetical protein [Dolichospermum sp. ST_sed4]